MKKYDEPKPVIQTPLNVYLKLKFGRLGTNTALHILSLNRMNHNAKSTLDIFYTSKNNNYQSFDLHLPNENVKGKTYPTIFYIHGGSWAGGDKRFYNDYCRAWAEKGYAVININYRLLPDYTLYDAYNDCKHAMNFAINNAEKFNINTHALFIIGDSAGAHLSALLASKLTLYNKFYRTSLLGLGLYYGVYNLKEFPLAHDKILQPLHKYFEQLYGVGVDSFYKQFSPIEYYTKFFPPCFLTSGVKDPLHKYSENFHNFLKYKHKKHESYFIKDKSARHGFLNFPKRKCSQIAFAKLYEFFNSILLSKHPKPNATMPR